ncbi:MAG: hypothetical protein JF627_01600, partial [Alphaproteobacteria bacterium]|nr:hypothetical protein [Alphaproteobacteria bacterium]
KSEEPPPEDTQLMASGAIWDARDDERIDARPPDLPAEEPSSRASERRHRGGLLGWLFGNSDDDEDAPPPPRRDSGR